MHVNSDVLNFESRHSGIW